MQIEKKPNPSVFCVPYFAGDEFPVARQHLADLPTRLALMRWTRGGDIPHSPAPPREMWRRASWYGSLQTGFQSWLKDGGFHGEDADDLDDLDASYGTLDEASRLEARVTATNPTMGQRTLHK